MPEVRNKCSNGCSNGCSNKCSNGCSTRGSSDFRNIKANNVTVFNSLTVDDSLFPVEGKNPLFSILPVEGKNPVFDTLDPVEGKNPVFLSRTLETNNISPPSVEGKNPLFDVLPVEGKNPVLAIPVSIGGNDPAIGISLDESSIQAIGRTIIVRNHGPGNSTIVNGVANIMLGHVSGFHDYIRLDFFVDSNGNPIVSKINVFIPSTDNMGNPLPRGWTKMVTRIQNRSSERAISLSVHTTTDSFGKRSRFIGNTISTMSTDNIEEKTQLISFHESDNVTELVSEDLFGVTRNAKPNSRLELYLHDDTGNLMPVGTSFSVA